MSKVLVDRELLDRILNWREGDAGDSGRDELIDILAAQPAEAEGVDFGFDDRSVKVSQEAYSIFLARERHHLAALSAVTAERDRLRKENERLKRAAQTNWNEFADSVGELEQLRAEVEELRKDSARLDFMVAQRALINSQNGTASPTVYRVCWPSESRQQDDWYPSERDAIDAAMAAKEA